MECRWIAGWGSGWSCAARSVPRANSCFLDHQFEELARLLVSLIQLPSEILECVRFFVVVEWDFPRDFTKESMQLLFQLTLWGWLAKLTLQAHIFINSRMHAMLCWRGCPYHDDTF